MRGSARPPAPGERAGGSPPGLVFVAESPTDARMVEGLAERFELTLLARGVAATHPFRARSATTAVVTGRASRLRHLLLVARVLVGRRRARGFVLVQGYGAAALVVNVVSRGRRRPAAMLVCSPAEEYYRCRRDAGDPRKPFRRRELALIGALARANARLGQRYVVLSDHLEDVVRRHGTSRPVHRIPVYGVDAELFRPDAAPRERLRADLGLPADSTLILFASRVAPEKDVSVLLAAFARLLGAGRDAWLVHRGEGSEQIVRHARRLGLAHRLDSGPAVAPRQMPPLYRACDLCVQASRSEGLGFAVLEALACGVPVVAAGVGGLRETIVPGHTGWTYVPGDDADLARAIAEVLDDPREAARRTAAGRSMVRERYRHDRAFDDLLRVIRTADLLARPGAP